MPSAAALRALLLAACVFACALPSSSAAWASAPCQGSPMPGGDWPAYGHDVFNSRSQPAEDALDPATAADLHAAWTFSTASVGDTSSAFDSTPVVAGGCVFVASTGGYVYALDAETGAVVWHRQVSVATAGLGGIFVGAPALEGHLVIYLVDAQDAPYAIAFDRSTGAVVWRSAPIVQQAGSYTNASAVIADGLLFFGYSAPEGDPHGVGGFALLDPDSGAIVKVTPTIPPADQALGYAGGGIWSTPAYDPASQHAYVGAGNPSSKTMQHPNTDAILEIDLDRARPTFGHIVASYAGNPDQYDTTLQTISESPVCAASDVNDVPYPLDDPACGQLDLDFGASPNLFEGSDGRLFVGELQKSGVYHAADAATMQGAWTRQIGLSCQACNAASTAVASGTIAGVSTPGGVMNGVRADDGGLLWTTPIGDGVHYQSTSVADGVAYTLDGNGFLDAFDLRDGTPVLERNLALDTGSPMAQLVSSGVAIAGHQVVVEGADATTGWVVAYRG